MKVIFTNLAKLELEDATAFYELEYLGLGKRFKQEVKKSIKRIIEYPKACSIERGDVRKCLLHKFPYKILYSIEDDHILIIAIAHLHRKPDYWIEREGI
ncbi:Plasmid stabilization system protein [Candidatus Brocadiaceae bacterium B188]|jgi:plasmid stabilization system protein ParE|nr:type II toxin-antitoxin system RelE/ParE family toxin [Candidatus Brocadia sapporoensis]MEB2310195.1 type II toxin-antitoxin system RelE/ParE family toxin [Candidatus Brocadiaceae bacterium]OQZ03643.1 MAG: plasmid stabilization protein [Candidatus Brocadia sp. UTAMX1]QQR67090.1 MAG: type II toxin-antitoxin system RelE/ParE family toxin [Candidatus Brocadia sp.]RZV58382.1 MAG: type II toxin-antitoxin system RelE/ParE family toxin [Candidatus Brocadia sp. BROELEC01]TWU54106.1 Plasmid stabiliz